jgi:hypothetical protein
MGKHMWEVSAEVYSRSAGDSLGYRDSFDTRMDALDCALSYGDRIADVWMQEYEIGPDGDWVEVGDTEWIQERIHEYV